MKADPSDHLTYLFFDVLFTHLHYNGAPMLNLNAEVDPTQEVNVDLIKKVHQVNGNTPASTPSQERLEKPPKAPLQ